jgi:hypothetical protein
MNLEIMSPRKRDKKKGIQEGREIPQFPAARFAAEYAEGIKK